MAKITSIVLYQDSTSYPGMKNALIFHFKQHLIEILQRKWMIHFQARLKFPKMVECVGGNKLTSKLIEIANNCWELMLHWYLTSNISISRKKLQYFLNINELQKKPVLIFAYFYIFAHISGLFEGRNIYFTNSES